jgi:hypothetical protein
VAHRTSAAAAVIVVAVAAVVGEAVVAVAVAAVGEKMRPPACSVLATEAVQATAVVVELVLDLHTLARLRGRECASAREQVVRLVVAWRCPSAVAQTWCAKTVHTHTYTHK